MAGRIRGTAVSLSSIRKVAVIGSGVMGAGIAAQMANAGFQVYLLDIVPKALTEEQQQKGLELSSPEVRNSLAIRAIEAMGTTQPAPLYDPTFRNRITPGNLEDHLHLLSSVDWIVEAVVEVLEIKQTVYAQIEKVRTQGTLVSSNTSGLSVADLIQHCSVDFRQHFAVTHFFNPPRYMYLVEIVPSMEMNEEAKELIVTLCEKKLGKGVVIAKDTPNFIANRIGTFGMLVTLRDALHYGLTVNEVDALTGTVMGRPKTATFRMLDLVGLDTLLHVVDNVRQRSTNEEEIKQFERPPLLVELVQLGRLGQKTGAGFYQKVKDELGKTQIKSLNLKTLEYEKAAPVQSPVLEAVKQGSKGKAGKLKALLFSNPNHPHAQFAWSTIKATLLYTASLIGEICDNIVEVDRAMRWGFNWELGPFELWDALGLHETVAKMEEEEEIIPDWIKQWLAAGHQSFYAKHNGHAMYAYKGHYAKVEVPVENISLTALKEQGAVVWSNSGASLIDLGDEVVALEFHSKSNAIGAEILGAIQYAVEEVSRNWRGLVIANEGKNFCVGANLMLLLMEAQNEDWDEIENIIRYFQSSMQKLKRLERPVVAAPHRMTLGGGVEACLPADVMIISPETYFGLVETGVGLIPAGGGCKEAALLAMQRSLKENTLTKVKSGIDTIKLQPYINQLFETIAMAKTSSSGHEITSIGFGRSQDRVIANSEYRIYEAKREVLKLDEEGYVPPTEKSITVVGKEGAALLKLAVQNMLLGHYITEHDARIAYKLAHVLTGGHVAAGTSISEKQLLDLECEAFLSLCGEPKTQARMSHMLVKGKPLRN